MDTFNFDLVPHPNFPPGRAKGVEVEIGHRAEGLWLTYTISHRKHVVWPGPARSTRTDDLWRTTCFELFLRLDGQRYVEFNFSPSTGWAAYAFEGHRQGRVELARDVPPHIERLGDGVEVDCDLGGLPRGRLRMGLSAVIEEEGGVLSYWALAHGPGPPDFHNPACFTATLPPPPGP